MKNIDENTFKIKCPVRNYATKISVIITKDLQAFLNLKVQPEENNFVAVYSDTDDIGPHMIIYNLKDVEKKFGSQLKPIEIKEEDIIEEEPIN